MVESVNDAYSIMSLVSIIMFSFHVIIIYMYIAICKLKFQDKHGNTVVRYDKIELNTL